MRISTPGQRGFLLWVKQQFPQVYTALAQKRPELIGVMQMQGFGLVEPSSGVTTAPASPAWISQITELAKVYLTTSTQKKLWDLQVKQAERGQAPLDLSQYQPGVNVGIEGGTQRMLMIGAGILAAVYLLPKLLRSRR